jgi:hypothetical protein
MRLVSKLIFVVVLLTPISAPAVANAEGIQLQVMASPAGFAGFAIGASPGHAFLCVAIELAQGIKEDCYGFYPRSVSHVFVGGPGEVSDEFKRKPERFSIISASHAGTISEEGRRQVFSVINTFNGANYDFTDNNCIDLVDNVARSVGWKTPTRSSTQTPTDYVKKLDLLN